MPNPAKGRMIAALIVLQLCRVWFLRSCAAVAVKNEGLLELYRTHKTTKDE